MRRLVSLLLVSAACGAPSLLDYHRETLDPLARAQLGCEAGSIDVRDTTPETMQEYMHDAEARRYTVRGCGRERSYLCYRFAMATNPEVECEWLDDRNDGGRRAPVHLGPVRVR